MEELFKTFAGTIATLVEGIAALFIAIGAAEALWSIVLRFTSRGGRAAKRRKEIWVEFAIWLLLALEFELAADVLRTAISPTWDDVGMLAAIAAIRTMLNYFLEKDIDKYMSEQPADA
jgi:uncharacterized membrane protein